MEINKPVKMSVARTVFYSLCIWSPWLSSYLAPVGDDDDGHDADDEDGHLFWGGCLACDRHCGEGTYLPLLIVASQAPEEVRRLHCLDFAQMRKQTHSSSVIFPGATRQ